MARWGYNLVHINGGSHEDLFGGVRFELGRLRKGVAEYPQHTGWAGLL